MINRNGIDVEQVTQCFCRRCGNIFTVSDRAKINNITCTACRGGKIKSYESVVKETAEIIADTEFYNGLRKSIKEDKEGKAIPWEEVKKEL